MAGINITEIKPGAKLSLVAVRGRKSCEIELFAASITQSEYEELLERVSDPFIPLEVVTANFEDRKKVISFESVRAKLSLLVIQGSDVFKWDDVQVDMIGLESGKKLHVLRVQNAEGEKHNRRRGVRIDLDIRMNIRQHQGITPVIVKDLSYCGFKILEFKGSNIDKTAPFVLELISSSDEPEKVVELIRAEIVRQSVLENGDVVSGCKVDKEFYGILQKYLAIKQLERARGKKNPNNLIKAENHKHWKQSIVYQLQNDSKEESES